MLRNDDGFAAAEGNIVTIWADDMMNEPHLIFQPSRSRQTTLILLFFSKGYVESPQMSGPEKGVITKGIFSLAESLASLESLDSLENGGTLFFQSLGVL